RGGHAIAKGFSREVMPGPEGRIAAPRVTHDLIARGRGEYGVKNSAVRQVALLNVTGDGNRVLFRPANGSRDCQRENQGHQNASHCVLLCGFWSGLLTHG